MHLIRGENSRLTQYLSGLVLIGVMSGLSFQGQAQAQAQAQKQVPGFQSVFGSNMVLPHGMSLTLTGDAAPNTSLTLEVNGNQYSVNSNANGHGETVVIDSLCVQSPQFPLNPLH